MKHSSKFLATACVLAFTLSGTANASISASVQTVCDKAEATDANTPSQTNGERQQAYSSMLSQHFNLSSCNGIQLLNSSSQNMKNSDTMKNEEREVASLTD